MKEGNKFKVFIIIFFSAMGGMLYGYDIGIIGGALPFIKTELGMTAAQESLLGGSVLFGGAFSILIGGVLADIFGRKNIIIASGLIFVISVFMIYDATTYDFLLISRLVQGIAVGFISITVPLYLTESVPNLIRGLAVTCFQLFLTAGILISTAVALLFISKDPITAVELGDWRGMFLTAIVPGLIVFLGGFLLIKSPRWLIMKNKEDEAEKILTQTVGEKAAKAQMAEVKELIAKTKNEGSVWKSLNKRHYLVPMLIVFSAAILAQMTGINSILQYAPTMLKETGLGSVYAAVVGGVAITAINFLTTIIAVMIADKIERKFVITFGTFMVSVTLLILSFLLYVMPDTSAKGWVLLIGFISYIFFFAIGPGAYIWVIMSELLPTNIRSKGLAVALFLNSMASAILAASVMPVTSFFGNNYSFILGLCGVCTMVYSYVAYRFIPKTNGRTLEEIEQDFVK